MLHKLREKLISEGSGSSECRVNEEAMRNEKKLSWIF